MSRIDQFNDLKWGDIRIPYFIGLFKPIVGSSFALFIYSVNESGIIILNVDEGKKIFFLLSLSFIAGFSERFVPDVISGLEDSFNKRISTSDMLRSNISRNLDDKPEKTII
jgi:hypothetical protein